MSKSKFKKTKILNHADISNEIETRSGLYDTDTGNDLLSRNTTFQVEFDESDKKYLKVSKEIGYRRGMGLAYCSLGSLYTRIKKYKLAVQSLKKAENILAEVDDKSSLAETYFILAKLYKAKGKHASLYISKARKLYMALRLINKVKEVDRLSN